MTREPDETAVSIDPTSCTVMAGHQHKAADVDSLACSIATNGQLNPVQVIKYDDGRLEIAAGRRRWLACTQLKRPLIANIFYCHGDDFNVQVFARSVRIAENVERVQPSAMDIALQLRAIRSEHGFGSSKELADSLGLSESAVKRYMSVFKASDHLQSVGQSQNIPLTLMLELKKCEKELGVPATRKLIDKAVRGELTSRDLEKVRRKKAEGKDITQGKPTPRKRKGSSTKVRTSFLELVRNDPSDDDLPESYVLELITLLQQQLERASVSLVEIA